MAWATAGEPSVCNKKANFWKRKKMSPSDEKQRWNKLGQQKMVKNSEICLRNGPISRSGGVT